MRFSRSNQRRQLRVEGLEPRAMLAGDVVAAADQVAATPAIIGDANSDGVFDQSDLVEVFQASKYDTGEAADWSEGDWNGDDLFDSQDLILAFQWGNYSGGDATKQAAGNQGNWPDKIVLPMGLESEGIERGKGHEFYLGGASWSGDFTHSGNIYKGDLRTGEGKILVDTDLDRALGGLSYDVRTDNLYAAYGDPGAFVGNFTNQGVVVYDGTTGEIKAEIKIGDGILTNDVLVTSKAVYVTDSINPDLYKIPLDPGGNPSNTWEKIEMTGFVMDNSGFNANGLVGDFDGNVLVVVNIHTGVLYRVDTATGVADPIEIQGEEQLFADGDGLYMSGRTLYIMQNFSNKIAVVQLSHNLTEGQFVKNLVSDDFAVPTTITGFGDNIYAINTHFCEITTCFGSNPNPADPETFQTEVVKVHK